MLENNNGNGSGDCKIAAYGLRRTSTPKWWCTTHSAPAWGSRGEKLDRCPKASLLPLESEILPLNPEDFPGGVAFWGATAPLYDTTAGKNLERGIHVHARSGGGGQKIIDRTFPVVRIKLPSLFGGEYVEIDEQAAVAYMVCVLLGMPLTHLHCPRCGTIHLDAGEFSVRAHRKHQCGKCGREFFARQSGFSNPLVLIKEIYEDAAERQTIPANRKLVVQQKDFPGGIQIWGSNPAVLWTQHHQEESGVHVHCYNEKGERAVDDTFDDVWVDGHFLDEEMVRYYMAQRDLAHLGKYLTTLYCSWCSQAHFDNGKNAVHPHREHVCEHCGSVFSSRKAISNPLVDILKKLGAAH